MTLTVVLMECSIQFVLLCADDMVIIAENECDMQRNLNLLNEYFGCNGLRVNINKTKINGLCQV